MNETPLPKTTLKRYVVSAIFGAIGGFLTITTVYILDELIYLIWTEGIGMDTEAPVRKFASIGVILVAGLLIGLYSKKFGAVKGNLDSVIEESLENGSVNWRNAFKDFGVGIVSISSGASLGPEAPAAMLSTGTASLAAKSINATTETKKAMSLGAISGMLGSLLSSPFLAGTMFIETSKKQIRQLRSELGYAMIASSFGMATFYIIYSKLYSFDLGIPAYNSPTAGNLLAAFIIGLVGALFGVIIALAAKALDPIYEKMKNKLVLKALFGATIAGVIAFIAPMTMFSGQHVMPDLIASAATMTFIALLALAFAKLFATLVLLKSGFFGGAIFPAIFAGAAIGLALNMIFDAPEALAISSAIAGLMTILTRQPFTAAFLSLVVAGTTNAIPIALAVSAGLIIVALVESKQKAKA